MKPTVDTLTEEFTRLIGPDAFAKAQTAIAAAKLAAEAAAKAAAEKAAAAAAAAKAAAEKAAAEKAAAAAANPGSGVPGLPGSTGTPLPGVAAPVATPAQAGTPVATPSPTPRPAVAPAPRPAPAPAAAGAAAAPAAPRPAPAPAVPMPTLPVQVVSHAAKGYNFDALVAPEQVVQAAQVLDRAGFGLDTITGVDWMAQNEMEVVYDYFHPTEALRVVVRTRLPRATPDVPSITAIFPGANWHERETHDFFGIRFTGHPNLKPFLLPEDADFHPLRKDYQ